MSGETTAPATTQVPAPEAPAQGQSPTQHHSARQPRDDGQRFAGPPAQGSPPEGQQPPAAAPPTRRRFTFVEDGKQVVEELDDREIEERIRVERNRRYLEKQATQKFQRASEIAKKAETAEQVADALVRGDAAKIRAYFEAQKKDPAEALAGVLEALLEQDEMTPEQKELAAAKAELAALAEEKRRGQEEAEVQAFHARMDAIRPEVEKVWTHALSQEHLPKTEAMLERAAEIFLTAMEAGQRLSPEQVAELTRWEMVVNQRGLVESMEPAHLFKHFPGALKRLDEGLSPEEFEQRFPSLAKRYWAHLAAKVRGRRGGQPAPAPSARPAPTQAEDGGGVLDPYLAEKLRAL